MAIKRVLITAGPTWVLIDRVRVISNIATGETGILLAERLQRLGAKVTLLLGPAEYCCINKKIRLLRFISFNDLKNKIIKELKTKGYDIVIHSAAVSDYRPAKIFRRKISSGISRLKIELVPTVKIIGLIKKIDPSVFLVGFKYEPAVKRGKLIKEARGLIKHSSLDLAVANTIDKKRYSSYILEDNKIYGPLNTKKNMVNKLAGILKKRILKI